MADTHCELCAQRFAPGERKILVAVHGGYGYAHQGCYAAADDVSSAQQSQFDPAAEMEGLRARVRELQAAHDTLLEALHEGEASDGYHTHRELYEYRMLYNAHAARGWLAAGIPVVKSRRHSDGEPCFGGGWFIVVAELPGGQVSNHYREEHWPLFHVPEVDLPPAYDGHTPAEAAERLRAALVPAPQMSPEDALAFRDAQNEAAGLPTRCTLCGGSDDVQSGVCAPCWDDEA